MHLIELPDGNWIDPTTITGILALPPEASPLDGMGELAEKYNIKPIPIPARVVIRTKPNYAHVINYQDFNAALKGRDIIIERIKELAERIGE